MSESHSVAFFACSVVVCFFRGGGLCFYFVGFSLFISDARFESQGQNNNNNNDNDNNNKNEKKTLFPLP